MGGQVGKHPHTGRGRKEGVGSLWRGSWERGLHLNVNK